MVRAMWPAPVAEFLIGQPRKVAAVAINFGKVYYGERATRELTVVNSSRHHLTLGEKTGCGCTRIKILNPAIPPGGRSAVRVSYTGIDPGRTGPASQQFIIFDNGKKLIPELRGVVHAVLAQSLRFNRTEISWRNLSGEPAHGGQAVVAENVSGVPASVAWSAGGEGRFFSIAPTSAVIAPGASVRFLFRPSRAIAAGHRSEAEAIVLRGTLQSNGRPVRLNFTFDAYDTLEPVLEAIPGALVLSPRPGVRLVSEVVRLVTGPGNGKVPHVLAVATSSSALHAVREDGGRILVSLHLPHGQVAFLGNVRVTYVYGEARSALDIPVFAAPGLSVPRQTRPSPVRADGEQE